MVGEFARERLVHGCDAAVGDPARGTVFLIDGIGGLLMGPLVARRALREARLPLATHLFDWHRGLRGELLADLLALRRNRLAAARLARLIRGARRAHPNVPLHVLAFSGGAGIAVFAAERLGPRTTIDTLILACPALSPAYPLTAALRHVQRCIALISRRDRVLLAAGTTLFGTIDRRFGRAAGLVGFRPPRTAQPDDDEQYGKLHQVFWRNDHRRLGHFGHHMGWAAAPFIRRHVADWLTDPGTIAAQDLHMGAIANSDALTENRRRDLNAEF